MEEHKKRLEIAISDMIEHVYKSHLKHMQSIMHRCAASCCDEERGTLESVQSCIEKCAAPLMEAQEFLQSELGQFHNRLQMCVKECNSDVRSRLPSDPNERDLSRSQYLFESCTGNCVDKYIKLLPGLLKSMKRGLENAKPPKKTARAGHHDRET